MARVARDSLTELTPDFLEAKGEKLQHIEDTSNKKNKRTFTLDEKKLGVRRWVAAQYPA